MDNDVAFNEAIIEEREQGIEEIQGQIREVNEMFKDLAVLVNDQGVTVGRASNLTNFCHCKTIMFYGASPFWFEQTISNIVSMFLLSQQPKLS